MTAPLDIVNRALSAIGARSGSSGTVAAIASLNENSNEAFQANMLYTPTVQDLLRAAHWDFARSVATLSLLKAAPNTPENPTTVIGAWIPAWPAPPWLYEYAYPAGCLAVRSISAYSNVNTGNGSLGSYVIGQAALRKFIVASDTDASGNPLRVILTNVESAIGIYTMDWSQYPDQWDSEFQEAAVTALAARLAMAITGNLQLGNMLMQQAGAMIQSARVGNGNEGQTIIDHIPDWIQIRGFQQDYFDGGYFAQPWLTPGWLGI